MRRLDLNYWKLYLRYSSVKMGTEVLIANKKEEMSLFVDN